LSLIFHVEHLWNDPQTSSQAHTQFTCSSATDSHHDEVYTFLAAEKPLSRHL